MWIVRLALQRPYTFVVMALLILILSPIVILRTPVDIFPDINIPVISIIWQFTGLSPQEIETPRQWPIVQDLSGALCAEWSRSPTLARRRNPS